MNRNLVTVKNCTSQFENINSQYECSTLLKLQMNYTMNKTSWNKYVS